MTAQMLPLQFHDDEHIGEHIDEHIDELVEFRGTDRGNERTVECAVERTDDRTEQTPGPREPAGGSGQFTTGTAAHADLAERLLDRPVAVAPWNRAVASPRTPAVRAERHLRLVADEPIVERARRGRLRTLVAGLSLAALVALASIGVLAFLGADAAASTPASSTGATPSTVAAAPVAVAEPAAPQVVVVQSGDSLWTVARRLQPKGDVRRLVDRLSARVGGSTLTAGQRIDVGGLLD